jgi:hypothetical protein
MIEDLVKPERTGKKYKFQEPIDENKIPETTWAYLAGFIDGEANLNFEKKKRPDCKYGFNWSLKIQIYSGNQDQIYRLRDRMGTGPIYRGNRKETPYVTYTLGYFGNNLKVVLERTLPYLILKRKSAEIMIEAYKTIIVSRPSFVREQKIQKLYDDFYYDFVTRVHRQKYLIETGKIILDSLEKELSNQPCEKGKE